MSDERNILKQSESEGLFSLVNTLDLGSGLRKRFITWSDDRKETQDRWIRNLKMYRKIHEEEVVIKPNRSDAYVGIAKEKTNAGNSRLLKDFFGTTTKHWEIRPTTIPDLVSSAIETDFDERMKKVLDVVDLPKDETEKAQMILRIREEVATLIEKEVSDEANKKAKNMSKKIQDDLDEAEYEVVFRRAMFEAALLGSGAVKAGTVNIKEKLKFSQDNDGETIATSEEEVVPGIEEVSIFDLYPDSDATDVSRMTGIFQRHLLSMSELKELQKKPGFDGAAIEKVLRENPEGNHEPLSFESDLDKIGDNDKKTGKKNRYEVLEYWGDLQDNVILEAIEDQESVKGLNQVNVWLIGEEVIKVGMKKSLTKRLPYFIFPYDFVINQLWGTGVPEAMEGSQKHINTATRLLLDCAAFSHIPNFEVLVNFLKGGEGFSLNMSPGKVWPKTRGDASTPAVRPITFTNIIPELLSIIQLFKGFADEETNLPPLISGQTQGQATLGRTSSGIAQVLSGQNVLGLPVVKNIDDFFVKPFFRELYVFNMIWSDDDEIKGDMEVVARGTSSVLAREIETNQLVNFANITENERDAELTHRDELLRAIANRTGIDEERFVKTVEQVDRAVQVAKEDPERKASVEAELRKLNAEIDDLVASAEKSRSSVEFDRQLLVLKRQGTYISAMETAGSLTTDEGDKKEIIASLEKLGQKDGLKSNNENA